MVDLHIELEKLVEIEGFYSADGHAHGVAKIVPDVVVFDEGCILREDGALCWFFHVPFQRHQALTACLVKKFVHGLERVEVALFSEFRSRENSHNSTGHLLENVQWVCDQHRADCCSADDDEFSRLNEHL